MKASGGRSFLAIAIVSVVFAAVTLVLAIVLFSAPIGRYESYETYGGDAYTGIQNATAQTANNVRATNEILSVGFGAFLLVCAFAFTIVSIYFFHKSVLCRPVRAYPYPTFNPQTAPMPMPMVEEPVKDTTWLCRCGIRNKSNVRTCKGCGAGRQKMQTEELAEALQKPEKQESVSKSKKCVCGHRYYDDECPFCGRKA